MSNSPLLASVLQQSSKLSKNASRAEVLLADRKRWRTWLRSLSEIELQTLETNWAFWGRKNQQEPPAIIEHNGLLWAIWAIIAGRGFGKTRTGAEWVRRNMCGDTPLTGGSVRHMALIAETAADARDVMVGYGKGPDEASGILQVHPKDFRPIYVQSNRALTWPNGAVATLYNGTEP